MDDAELWRQYEPFNLKQGIGFWMPGSLTLPFGVLSLSPTDGRNALSSIDLTRWPHEDIIATVEHTVRRWGGTVAFSFSPSCKGDVEGFKTLLLAKGYQKTHDMHWLVLEDLSGAEAMPRSACDVAPTHDGARFEAVFRVAFPEWDSIAAAMALNVASRRALVQTTTFLAQDQDKPVGTGSICYEGEFGYMHSLAVLPDYRGSGIGKHLVRERLLEMKRAGVRYVMCTVDAANEASLAVQKRAGYRVFAGSETWKKVPDAN